MSAKNQRSSTGQSLFTVIAVLSLVAFANAQGTEKALYTFTSGTDGGFPFSGVISDAAGNLYGTSPGGGTSGACGSNGCGMVYKLRPNGSGGWTQTILHSFTGGSDGVDPIGGLVMDSVGNIFGTTGGQNSTCTPIGTCGTVFKLTPNGDGTYTESTLYRFQGGADGENPEGSLILDTKGNLYGSTVFGGVPSCYANVGCGTVFQLHPNTDGSWTEKTLHRFVGGSDGAFMDAGLTFDTNGNLYGVTTDGGGRGCTGFGCGTVFRLSKTQGWKERVLYRFTGGSDGSIAEGGVTFDGVNSFYGVTLLGGDTTCVVPGEPLSGCGSVYQLTHSSTGWTKTVLHNFTGGSDGISPQSSLTLDNAGNLYGVTGTGGSTGCSGGHGCGTIFSLTPGVSGWTESVLYGFSGGADGSTPWFSGVIRDSVGNLFGTTSYGGDLTCADNPGFGCGTVFEWSPQ
jgi:hypothetical protein